MKPFLSLALAMLLALPMISHAQTPPDPFLQGPEDVGHTRSLAGKVIGVHTDLDRNCYIVLADRAAEQWEGLGGGGRFFLCRSKNAPLAMGEQWSGAAVQEGTRLHRMGPRRRVLPLFVEAGQ